MYSDQLQFLNKIYDDHNTVDSMMPEIGEGLENTHAEEEQTRGTAEDAILPNTHVPSNQTRTRKHKKTDEIELKLLKALEPVTPCSKMSFLQSLMPHLKHYTDGEFLNFQMGVLNVIENINKRKEAAFQPQTNYSSHMPSYHSASSYMPRPPSVIQHQSFLPAQQPLYSPQQYPPQISNDSAQHHSSSPHHLYRPQNPATPVYNTTPCINRTQSTKESQSALQLQNFCYSDSSADNLESPTTPSGESTYSDQINFGTP